MSPRKPEPPDGRPLPARLDPRLGRSGPARARRAHRDGATPPRRRTRRAALVARVVAGALSVVLLATSGWGWYLGQVAEATVNRTDAIPSSGNEGSGASAAMNLLLVGNDSRAELTPEQISELNAGGGAGLNTDTMILVHLPADGSRASFVSFPRDSYVRIPGHGWDKLNAAYAYGYTGVPDDAPETDRQAAGAQLLVQTVSQLTGLRIDHYAEVDLLGFFELSNIVGGVEVNLCAPVDDRAYSGAVFPAGPQTISGAEALQFVRQRYGLPRGDLDRIVRQQVFIAGVLRNMLDDDVLLDLGKQRRLVEAAARSLTVDQNLDLLRLAEQMQSVTAGEIEFQTIPYIGDDRDDRDRYILRLEDEETLHRFFAHLSAEPEAPAEPPAETPAETPAPPATVDPAAVSVQVLNGSGVPGLAGQTADDLQTAGFGIAGTGNADSMGHTQTVVRYAAGDEAQAATVAAQVPGAVTEEDAGAAAGTVTLVLGTDFDGLGRATAAPPPPEEPEGSEEPDEVAGEDRRTAADTSCIH